MARPDCDYCNPLCRTLNQRSKNLNGVVLGVRPNNAREGRRQVFRRTNSLEDRLCGGQNSLGSPRGLAFRSLRTDSLCDRGGGSPRHFHFLIIPPELQEIVHRRHQGATSPRIDASPSHRELAGSPGPVSTGRRSARSSLQLRIHLSTFLRPSQPGHPLASPRARRESDLAGRRHLLVMLQPFGRQVRFDASLLQFRRVRLAVVTGRRSTPP